MQSNIDPGNNWFHATGFMQHLLQLGCKCAHARAYWSCTVDVFGNATGQIANRRGLPTLPCQCARPLHEAPIYEPCSAGGTGGGSSVASCGVVSGLCGQHYNVSAPTRGNEASMVVAVTGGRLRLTRCPMFFFTLAAIPSTLALAVPRRGPAHASPTPVLLAAI